MRLLQALALLAVLAVAGCAELQPVPAHETETVEFELAGRIATRYRDEAASGNVAWRHSRDSDEMLITTPVGSSMARIVRTGSEVVLTTADQKEFRANDAEALTEKALGFRVPLAGLTDWVRGRQVEGAEAAVVRDKDGRLASLKQNGWSVEYQEFRPDGLPVRMKLTYPGIELRLAIHEWKIARQ
jgi:outer membrane lipoprotein LolB